MEKLNQYHRQAIAKKMKSIAYWRKHPMSREECLNQFKQLREQRSLRESRFLIQYLQPIITQYFIDNKSEIWLLFLIAHSKR